MNLLWAGMIVVGIIYACFTGNLGAAGDGAISYARDGVTLGISMVGVMAFWMGLMEIATQSGIIERIGIIMKPFLKWLFPNIPEGSKCQEYIGTNMIANFLGLGWASTPAGLKAMEELAIISEKRGRDSSWATDEMCTFLVINISSLQLIPINIIGYRSQYGSLNPTAILAPSIVATCISTLVGIIYCKWKQNSSHSVK